MMVVMMSEYVPTMKLTRADRKPLIVPCVGKPIKYGCEPIPKPNNKEKSKMEKMTQKEAFKAACEFVDERMGNESISIPVMHDPGVGVYSVEGWTQGSSREFAYGKVKPVAIPKKGQAVIGVGCKRQNTYLMTSRGIMTDFLEGPALDCTSDISGEIDDSSGLLDWEEVEVVRNGRHAKALELLQEYDEGEYSKCYWEDYAGRVSKFLGDEPGKGGEQVEKDDHGFEFRGMPTTAGDDWWCSECGAKASRPHFSLHFEGCENLKNINEQALKEAKEGDEPGKGGE